MLIRPDTGNEGVPIRPYIGVCGRVPKTIYGGCGHSGVKTIYGESWCVLNIMHWKCGRVCKTIHGECGGVLNTIYWACGSVLKVIHGECRCVI